MNVATAEKGKNSRNDVTKQQRTPKGNKQPIDNLLGKMTMVISHAHFHRTIYRGSYTEILKALCTKNIIPYVSPLEENPD